MHLYDESLIKLQSAALASGTAKRLEWSDRTMAVYSLEWDVSGNCMLPKALTFESRPDADRIHAKAAKHRSVYLKVRCRRCDRCLKARRNMWAFRAIQEVKAAERTWFVTLTFRPAIQLRALNECRAELIRNGLDFDALKSSEQFRMRHGRLSPYLTKFLKRVRKNTGASIRYLLVAEAHVSGAPHYHLLVHHTVETAVTYRDIKREWSQNGFLESVLMEAHDTQCAWYVCKYLGKDADARVRASQHYGNAITFSEHRLQQAVNHDLKRRGSF